MPLQLYDVETRFQHLRDVIKSPATIGYKLLSISKFLGELLNENNKAKYDSYFADIFPSFAELLLKNDFKNFSFEELNKFLFIYNSLREYEKREDKNKIPNIISEAKNNLFNPVSEKLSESEIPLVVIDNEDDNDRIKYGFIVNLNLSTEKRKDKNGIDYVKFLNLVDLKELEIIEHLNFIVKEAKKLCGRATEVNKYNYIFYFDKKDYLYTGTSLGLAAMCLVLNSIYINSICEYYYKFKGDCVFSGAMTENGLLLKLDEESLRIKLKTVFYSGYNKFVIPEDNIKQAKAQLAELNKIHPDRKLELIPVNNFLSIFDNPKIVEKYKLTYREKITKIYDAYRKPVNISMAILFFAVVFSYLFFYLIPHLDKNPVYHNFIDNKYVIYNKYGVELWKSANLSLVNKSFYENYKGTRCILTDIDKDEINELIYLVYDENEIECNHTIFCSNNKLKNFPMILPLRELNYPNDPVHNFLIYLKQIYLLDCNNDGNLDILYTGLHYQFYPTILGAVNFDGEQISEFWNEGHSSLLKVIDINNTGKPDIFFCGCNNRDSLECAALIVFDPEYISGSSPYTDPLNTGKPGLEKYYILFPRTVLLEQTSRERNDVFDLRINSDKTISCWTLEGNNTSEETVSYDFDINMNLIQVSNNDAFKKQYNKLRTSIRKDLPEFPKYLNELKQKVRWWDGDKFVNYRAINRHYLEAVKNKLKN